MRKLRLEIEMLQVESFPVAHEQPGPGTVRGHYDEQEPIFIDDGYGYGGGANTVGTCIGPTYCCPVSWKPTCPATCYGTCPVSCEEWECGL